MAVMLGIDVSAFQKVNYATTANHVTFLIAKATEGAHTTSSAWRTHWTGAFVAHILRGSYHLCHPSQSSAIAEADHYAAVLASAGFVSGRDLPPMLDIEPGHGLGKTALTTWAVAFMGRVDDRLGLNGPDRWLRCGVYIGDSVPNCDRAAIAKDRVFWRGTYPSVVDEGAVVPAGCSIAQWVTAASEVPGVTGNGVDRDVARLEDLRRMAPAYFPQPEPVPEEDMPLTTAEIDKIAIRVLDISHIPNKNDPSGPAAGTASLAGLVGNIEATQDVDHGLLKSATAQLGGLKGAIDALAAAIAALDVNDTPLDVNALILAVRQASEDGATAALEAGVVDVDVQIHDKTQE
jgi:GH25 family lysozyme M1 (1,4-beta-N-acetylmuramidase)